MTRPAGVTSRTTEDVPTAKGSAAGTVASVSGTPTIALVDDDPYVLHSMTRLLAVAGHDVRAFSSPESLLAEISSIAPACVISDLSMPGLTGLELQSRLEESNSLCSIIFVTAHGDIRTSVLAMRNGAVDFLTKPFQLADLLDAVDRALARIRRARERAEQLAAMRRRIRSLTEREREVYTQVVSGLLNKQIAANLGISEKTVKVHRARVMRKIGLRSVAQLARFAERLGEDSRDEPSSDRALI